MLKTLSAVFVFGLSLAPLGSIAQAQEATGDLVPYVDTQLVGFTSTTVTGDAGVLGMLNACHLEFSASRMCTSEEVMNTVAMPVLPSETSAWVRPVYASQSLSLGSSGSLAATLDASGVYERTSNAGSPTQSCEGWSSASAGDKGLGVTDSGSFILTDCALAYSVACCAYIVVVPEPSASLGLGAGTAGLLALAKVKSGGRP